MNTLLTDHCKRIAVVGGSAKSKKKTEAARRNARKPRPNARKENRKPQESMSNDSHSAMLSQIAAFVEDFSRSEEDTTLICVLNLLEEYYEMKADEIRMYVRKEKEKQ
jgi:hypothetical protein